MVSASCKWKREQQYYDLSEWRGKRALDGGVLMNQAIHHIDLLIYLIGEIKHVCGFYTTRFVNIESENIAVASIMFKNKCLGTIEATTATQPEDYEGSITILGENGTLKIGGFASNTIDYFKNKKKTQINLKNYSSKIKNVYGYGHINFYNFVLDFMNKKIKKNQFDINNSIKSVAVVETIINSFKSKKVEKIKI